MFNFWLEYLLHISPLCRKAKHKFIHAVSSIQWEIDVYYSHQKSVWIQRVVWLFRETLNVCFHWSGRPLRTVMLWLHLILPSPLPPSHASLWPAEWCWNRAEAFRTASCRVWESAWCQYLDIAGSVMTDWLTLWLQESGKLPHSSSCIWIWVKHCIVWHNSAI